MPRTPVGEIAARLKHRIADLARELLGEPNQTLSTSRQLRFGTKGSIVVEIDGPDAGRWYDLEHAVDGDGLKLICHHHGLTKAAARDWARDWLGLDAPAGTLRARPAAPAPETASARTDDKEQEKLAAKVARIVAPCQDIVGTPAEGECSEKPEVKTFGGGLPQHRRQAEELLLAVDVYQRGGDLVRACPINRVAAGEKTRGVRRPAGALTLRPVDAVWLQDMLTHLAVWLKFDKRSEDWVRIDCPPRVAEAVIANAGNRLAPVLRGLSEVPLIGPDGRCVVRPGFDELTGMLHDYGGATFQAPPARVNRVAAIAAFDEMMAPFREVPFAGASSEEQPELGAERSRNVLAALILTAVCRPLIETAPLFVVTAPTPGTGKSLLVDVVSILATGRPAPVLAWPRDAGECEKRLVGVLLAGDPLVSIDNLEGSALGGDLLNQALTQGMVKLRPLGTSVTTTVPSVALFTATGNNLQVRGDMTRRVLACNLDAGVERPEQRTFEIRNLREHVAANRPRLVRAALTVLTGFVHAGSPRAAGVRPLGGFEEWDGFVRQAILWLGRADPVDTQERLRASEAGLVQLGELVEVWGRAFDDKPTTVRQAIIHAQSDGDLRDVLMSIAGERDAVNPRRLGGFLTRWRGRPVADRWFVAASKSGHAVGWSLAKRRQRPETFDERAAIAEFDGGLSRADAERLARDDVARPEDF